MLNFLQKKNGSWVVLLRLSFKFKKQLVDFNGRVCALACVASLVERTVTWHRGLWVGVWEMLPSMYSDAQLV